MFVNILGKQYTELKLVNNLTGSVSIHLCEKLVINQPYMQVCMLVVNVLGQI